MRQLIHPLVKQRWMNVVVGQDPREGKYTERLPGRGKVGNKMDQSRTGEVDVDKVDDQLEGVWGGGRWGDEKPGRVSGGK